MAAIKLAYFLLGMQFCKNPENAAYFIVNKLEVEEGNDDLKIPRFITSTRFVLLEEFEHTYICMYVDVLFIHILTLQIFVDI